jgi:hypothetical protein
MEERPLSRAELATLHLLEIAGVESFALPEEHVAHLTSLGYVKQGFGHMVYLTDLGRSFLVQVPWR